MKPVGTSPQSQFQNKFINTLEASLIEPINLKFIFELVKSNWDLLDCQTHNQAEQMITAKIEPDIDFYHNTYLPSIKQVLDWIKENRRHSDAETVKHT